MAPKHRQSGRTAQVQFKHYLHSIYTYLHLHSHHDSKQFNHTTFGRRHNLAFCHNADRRPQNFWNFDYDLDFSKSHVHAQQAKTCVWEDSLLRPKHFQARRSSHMPGKTPSVSLIVTCKWHFHVDVSEVQGSASKTLQKDNDSTVEKANASIPIGFSCGTQVHNKSKEHVLTLPFIRL